MTDGLSVPASWAYEHVTISAADLHALRNRLHTAEGVLETVRGLLKAEVGGIMPILLGVKALKATADQHAALVVALDALVAEMRRKLVRVDDDFWADRLEGEVAKHREGR